MSCFYSSFTDEKSILSDITEMIEEEQKLS